VEVFGRKVRPGELIHADKHGFLVIAPEDQAELLAAARYMDMAECSTLIAAARSAAGKNAKELLELIEQAGVEFSQLVRRRDGVRTVASGVPPDVEGGVPPPG
jgi:hypothetical protein